MFFVPFSIIIMALGFFLYFLTYVIPLLRQVYFDWLAMGIMAVPSIVLLYGITSKKLLWFMEKTPINKYLCFFLRRDGDLVPVLGGRPYAGESFIDIPRLGLIHDLGKGCVYDLAGNKIRFCLENVNHTASPKYANFNHWLYMIGFNNMREVQETLYGKFEEKKEEVIEKIDRGNGSPIENLIDDLLKLPNKELNPNAI